MAAAEPVVEFLAFNGSCTSTDTELSLPHLDFSRLSHRSKIKLHRKQKASKNTEHSN